MLRFHLYLLLLPFVALRIVSAVGIQKERLCGEVCWTYFIGDTQCQPECVASPTPTEAEAEHCQNCISDCVSKFIHGSDVSKYTDCRRDCLNKYFGPFMGSYQPIKKDSGPTKRSVPIESLPEHFTDPDEYIPSRNRICAEICKTPDPVGVILSPEEVKDIESDEKECFEECIENPSYEIMSLQFTAFCADHCQSPLESAPSSTLHQCLNICLYHMVVEPTQVLLDEISASGDTDDATISKSTAPDASTAPPNLSSAKSSAISGSGIVIPQPWSIQNSSSISDQASTYLEANKTETFRGSEAVKCSKSGIATMIANINGITNTAGFTRYPRTLFFFSTALGIIGLPLI